MAASCGVSSSILSDSERSSLYAIKLNSNNGQEIKDGSILAPGSRIVPTLSKLPGAADPGAFEFELEGYAGRKAAAVRIRSASFAATAQASLGKADAPDASPTATQVVELVDGALPAIPLPAAMPPGAYKVSMKVIGKDGSIDLRAERTVFVGVSAPIIESATSFPPTVEPGAPALLGLSVGLAADEAAGEARAADPWIEWSAAGAVFAAGPLSAGLDKAVWSAPRAAGAYSVAVQVYPAPPLDSGGFGFPASAESRRAVSVMAIANPAGSGDDFADSLSFLSLLRLDGDFADAGTRPRIAQPEAFGSPELDVYASGFGYRFGPASGVLVPELMPPAQDDRLSAFFVLVRLAPRDDDGTGVIARFASDDGSHSLVIGLDAWKPYAEFAFDGKIQRSASSDAIPSSPLTLQASFAPSGERLDIRWYAEGERIDSPSMPLPPPPGPGGAVLGGPGSLVGVYDGFGLSAGASSPSYRLAARRKWKSALIYAEGFEDGRLPAPSGATVGASASAGSLALESGSELGLVPSFAPGDGVAIEVALSGDRASARLVFSKPGGAALFSIRGTGEVEDASGKALGALDLGYPRISLSIASSDEGFSLRSGVGDRVFVTAGSPDLALSLSRAGGVGALSIERILARHSPAPKGK